jgi:hypothetical protein
MSLVLEAVVELTEEGTYRWKKVSVEGDEEDCYRTEGWETTTTFRTGIADALRFDVKGALPKVFSEGDGQEVKELLSRLGEAIKKQLSQPVEAI